MFRKVIKLFFNKLGFQVLPIKTYQLLTKSKRTYSQIGEDIIVSHVFALKGISSPSFLDIGANDPIKINNTFIFYERGARGVNVDANPACIEKFQIVRPLDINLNIGIAGQSGQAEFYRMENDGLSTFSTEEVNKYTQIGYRLKDVISVELYTLQQLLEQYCNNKMPDFLSIDTEGLDFAIIKQIDFEKQRPKVICVETSEHSPDGAGVKRYDLIQYIIELGYFEYGNTWLNSVFVDSSWFFNSSR